MRVCTFLILLISFVNATVNAQSQQSECDECDPFETKTCGLFGINYLSNNVYLGRKDTMTIPYLSPYLGIHFYSGFYCKALVSYTTAGTGGHIDLATIQAGVDHTFGEHFEFGADAEKYFYNKNSISVLANLLGGVTTNAMYLNNWLEPGLRLDLNINKKSSDIALGTSLDHEFSLDKDKICISPTFTVFSGTRNYLDEYYINRLTKKDKTLKLQHVISNSAKFQALSYEMSCKIICRANHWLFTIKPTYVLPLNPAIIELPKHTVTEKLTNTFFLEIDICYRS